MTVNEGINIELEGRTGSEAAKAPKRAAAQAERGHFLIRTYNYFTARVKSVRFSPYVALERSFARVALSGQAS